jgi:propionyl-CoA carboxylase beta chain
MSWSAEIEELRRREELARRMGGAEKVARQHEFGKLTVRERVAQLVDEGTFWEIGKTAGVARYDEHGALLEFTPSNSVFGLAELDGRPVVVSGDDFTVRGGSNDASISAKRVAAEALSLELRLPHVRLLDGMSGGGSVKTIEQAGRTYIPELPGWHSVIDHLNVAPSVPVAAP